MRIALKNFEIFKHVFDPTALRVKVLRQLAGVRRLASGGIQDAERVKGLADSITNLTFGGEQRLRMDQKCSQIS